MSFQHNLSQYPFLLLFFLPLFVFGQKEKKQIDRWYFGPRYGIDFTSGSLEIDYASAMFTYEAATTISDENGNLLFYTNAGGREDGTAFGGIWNKQHQLMDGGDLGTLLGGGYSAAQGCITFRKPGTIDQYCLFTVDEHETLLNTNSQFPTGKGLSYFEIDMSANGGLGKVTTINQKLLNPSFEYLSATIHQNCEDYWVIALTGHYAIEDNYDVADSIYVFPVTAAGVQAPMITPLPNGIPSLGDEYGLIKIAPDGSGFLCGAQYFEFDKSTGAIGAVTNLAGEYGLLEGVFAFSSNSQFIYNFRHYTVDTIEYITATQVELAAASPDDIVKTTGTVIVSNSTVMGYPQLAPDRLLYLPVQSESVNNPTALYAIHDSEAKGMAADFKYTGVNLSGNPNGRFISLGNYTDNLFNTRPDVTIDVGPDQLLSCVTDVSLTLEAPPGFTCYLWSDGSTDPTLEVSAAGTYWLEAYDECRLAKDSVIIELANDFFELDLGMDTMLCESTDWMIAPTLWPDASYLWEDSSTIASRLIGEEGEYWLEVSRGLCVDRDTIAVSYRSQPRLYLSEEDQSLCQGDSLQLYVTTSFANDFFWQDGSTGSSFLATTSGAYRVQATNECGIAEQSIVLDFEDCDPPCPVYIPNAFSPNGDGINDELKAFSPCTFVEYRLRIFDRWGGILFDSQDSSFPHWDGGWKGTTVQTGVYVYLFDYGVLSRDGSIRRFQRAGDCLLTH